MEEQIREAKQTISLTGSLCKIFSIIGILGTFIYAFGLNKEGLNKNVYFWSILGTSLGSSLSIGALGSIAESSKRTKAPLKFSSIA